MNTPSTKPIQQLHLETRCFLEWLETRPAGKDGEPPQLEERLRDLCGPAEGWDYQAIWDTLLGSLFQEWVETIREEISGAELPSLEDRAQR